MMQYASYKKSKHFFIVFRETFQN